MGRSVSYLSYAEYVIYFTADWISAEDENGEYDEFSSQYNWEDFKGNLVSAICHKLKSYYEIDKWDNDEVSIFLRNELAEIGISEYCGLYSLSIRVREGDFYVCPPKEGLAKHHCNQVRKTLEKSLVKSGADLLNRIGTFSNGVGVFQKA